MKKSQRNRSGSQISDIGLGTKTMSSNTFALIVFVGVALRAATSLYHYSGFNKPPLFGDYEAQRHWQEITINTPVNEWYINTTNNDLLYWGLDYPPLTAYHSYGLGKIAKYINPDYVELSKSKGYYSEKHKYFMRTTVLVTDLLIYIPATIFLIKLFQMPHETEFLCIISLLYYPGLLLIDYGHFQYNNVSLGLMLAAFCFILREKDIMGSIFFCLALNYKQMELYHSLPFFYYLFRKCFSSKNKWIPFNFLYFLKIAVSVVGTFIICWFPWLFSNDQLLSVITRLFPFNRGIFEDKVSNFWCVLNVFLKVRDVYTVEQNLYACLVATIVSITPSMLTLFFYPSKKGLMYAILNSSLGFFLFSYHVHEKSILLAAIPALTLIWKDPQIIFWFLQIANFSMIPLLYKDNLIIAYLGLSILFESLFRITKFESKKKGEKYIKNLRYLSLIGSIILTILYLNGLVPNRYPHLYELLISAYCCVHFLGFLFYFTLKQFLNRNDR